MFIFACLASLSTIFGGLFSLKFSDYRHLILAFSAGTVMGVCLFDLLPEALAITQHIYSINIIFTLVAIGFAIYFVVNNLISITSHTDNKCDNKKHLARMGGSTLSAHSLLDGIALGLMFTISPRLGIAIAVAIISHDFSDGINTVNIIIKNGGTIKQAFHWLLIDAIAPIIGAISTLFFTLSPAIIGLIIACFAGFFLYIGASDLIPECHHGHPKHLTNILMVLGMIFMWIVVGLA